MAKRRFKPGDVVECIDASRNPIWPEYSRLLRKGSLYRVEVVLENGALRFTETRIDISGLGYCSERFRKLRRAKADFAAMVRACQPARTTEVSA